LTSGVDDLEWAGFQIAVIRSAHSKTLFKTSLPGIKLFARGKVRDIYELGDNRLLIVATDRLSAFDVVMKQGIPNKGRVLTQLSCFWFGQFGDATRTHFITKNTREFPSELHPYTEVLSGRSMLVEKARPFPIECVVRGYLAGSGWKDYRTTGEICGVRLPMGLTESARLEEPIFTPATKAATGHDQNISLEKMASIVGQENCEALRSMSLALYARAREFASQRGIIIADTKFEWGIVNGRITLIDEVLTPDSSRFWPMEAYEPGKPQPSFDKQFVRDYLESVNWNKKPPPPTLPEEVVQKTSEKYREALRRLTGEDIY
jgi:phosphoribosylaminoimidazole-succinocarboxamide synthase